MEKQHATRMTGRRRCGLSRSNEVANSAGSGTHKNEVVFDPYPLLARAWFAQPKLTIFLYYGVVSPVLDGLPAVKPIS